LNDRNPVMRIIAPIPRICACVRKNNNYMKWFPNFLGSRRH
jgi:hypothetical protein